MEILAPAGGEQTARAALMSGADAIYLGLSDFSARESAENFGLSALGKVIADAHLLGARVYVCLNTLIKDSETERFFSLALKAWNAGADALLVQDLFLGKTLKEAYPEMQLHLSTQAGVCNVWGARIAAKFGFSRVVLARETPLEDIAEISKIIETEAFVQGALCTCFSGQCYLSSFAGNNSGNRGRCKQPCRKRYSVDRRGYENQAYALSLSDLSVGKRVHELIAAGVTSLKIEGRLRRAEYVSAAVGYYRALLDGAETAPFSPLKRAFNRGDYTKGLAFGQDKSLISRKVQGHIGEKLGKVEVRGGKYFCKGNARQGDCFKILREGCEVGGAVFLEKGKGGFFLSSGRSLREGDEVRITTDTQNVVNSAQRYREIVLRMRFVAEEKPKICCGEFVYTGENALQRARSAPLTEEELKACFCRTDGLDFCVRFEEIVTENAFLPKSALNALRRDFYAALLGFLLPQRPILEEKALKAELFCEKGCKTAVAVCDFFGLKSDILILKPRDYAQLSREDAAKGEGEKYLYLPPYLTARDERLVREAAAYFDGIYCDGYYGLALAEEYRKPLFAGTGFNVTNRYAVARLKEAGVKYFALSKELCAEEQRALAAEGAFALSLGSVKVMDLCYCPFERTCADCDRRERYTLTDEDGRAFPLRRYRLSDCRFELFNCAPLAAYNGETGAIVDMTTEKDGRLIGCARDKDAQGRLKGFTKGHYDRSML